jgi:transcriptional regulator with XRE-family HTH domain
MVYCTYHMETITVNQFSGLAYADDMKRRHKNGHNGHAEVGFPERLVELRRERGWTQQALCALVRCGITQLKRYEGGTSQPTLDVIKRLAQALRVSSDYLLFGKDERGPDDDLRLQFEAVTRFSSEEKKVVKSILEGMILKHEAKRWSSSSS